MNRNVKAVLIAVLIALFGALFPGAAHSDEIPETVPAPVVVISHPGYWHCLPPIATVWFDDATVIVETESGVNVQNGVPFAIYNQRVDLVTSGHFDILDLYGQGWEATGWDYGPATATSGRYNAPAPAVPCQGPRRLVKGGILKPSTVR